MQQWRAPRDVRLERPDLAGGRLGAIFGANLLGGLLTFLALIALVIPGVVVACGYSVAAEVAALESGSAGDALRRSWDLTKGFKLKALVLWVVSVSLILLVFLGAGALGGFVAALAGGLDALVTLLAAFVSLLIYPLISCVFTLFYYDLRVRKEGFDLEVLSRQRQLSSEEVGYVSLLMQALQRNLGPLRINGYEDHPILRVTQAPLV